MDSPHSSSSSSLFIADVPSHLEEPDFVACFQNLDGFVRARLRRDRNSNRVGFVDFADHESAASALERFQGYKFDRLQEEGITVHFTHESRPKRRNNSSNATHSYPEDGYRSYGHRDLYRETGYARGAGAAEGRLGHMGIPMMAGMAGLGGVGGMTVHPDAMGGTMPFFPYNIPYPAYGYGGSMALPPLPPEAVSTLYIEGLPIDATEREMSHIFRPMPGFLTVRILQTVSKQYPNRTYNLCFAEFDNKYQATVAMHILQGYKMDKNDVKGLHISYAKTARKERRRPIEHQGVGQDMVPTKDGVYKDE